MAKEKVDFDAVVEFDDKLMKHVDDWPAPVRWGFDKLNWLLEKMGKPAIDEEALKHPGEYFDALVAEVKAFPARSPKAILIKNAVLWALEYVHAYVHPNHVEKAGA
jgi:hypothetical protein